MERSTVAFFQFLIIHLTVTGAAAGQSLEKMVGTLGDSVWLPCHSIAGNGTPSLAWLKDGRMTASRNLSGLLSPSENNHFSISNQGSLNIDGLLLTDEGIYLCNDLSLDPDTEKQTGIQLLIVSGPTNVRTDITPATALLNGTLFVRKGSSVSFNCSCESYPSQDLSLVFQGFASNSSVLASRNRSPLEFSIPSIQPTNQGNYSCIARNALSNQTAIQSTPLLVYYAPDRHPECYWKTGNDSSHLLLHCSWDGSYPLPTLHWEEELGVHRSKQPVLNVSMTTESLEETLNRTQLYDGQTLKCTGHNQMLDSGDKFCSLTLKAPYPQGDPLVTALEGSNVTLKCMEASSFPLAKTTWRRKISQEELIPSAKYIVSELGPEFILKIVNISKEDEGIYFCRSENPLTVKELEVFLTVTSSAKYTGGVVGTFIAVLIIGVAIVVGTSAYRNRDRICLGTGFGLIDEARNDVLHLVESDEEEIFAEPASRITTLANGHTTSLVQIHRIPSSDHEDLGITDTEAEETTKPSEQELVTI